MGQIFKKLSNIVQGKTSISLSPRVNRQIQHMLDTRTHNDSSDFLFHSDYTEQIGSLNLIEGSKIANADHENRRVLRDWWHGVLARRSQYNLFGIFLVLDSNKEAVRYLTEYGRELNHLSGTDCCIFALSKQKLQYRQDISEFSESIWASIVSRHVRDGLSVKVANILKIPYSHFPCLVLFKDIRKSEFELIELEGLTAEEIAKMLSTIFSIIHSANEMNDDPLAKLHNHAIEEDTKHKGVVIRDRMFEFSGKALEKVMEALVKSFISSD